MDRQEKNKNFVDEYEKFFNPYHFQSILAKANNYYIISFATT